MHLRSQNPAFVFPPCIRNNRGEVRKVGFEFEFAGPGLDEAAGIVQDLFGGRHIVDTTFAHRVVDTRFGEFSIEIDSSLLKDKRYEPVLRQIGIDLEAIDTRPLEQVLIGLFSTLVPFEIGTPPIPLPELGTLEELRQRLRSARAEGTRASLLYAFGMHINPEIPDRSPALLRDILRAFILLYPWLKELAEVDISRSISPYIKPFGPEYARLILQADYRPSPQQLIADYLRHNPTRNRPLDMLPVLAHLDRQAVEQDAPDLRLVRARPAFHYRLPNCMVDEPDWTLAQEWNGWVQVERLACDKGRLAEMAREYLSAEEQSLRPFYDRWPEVLRQYVEHPA